MALLKEKKKALEKKEKELTSKEAQFDRAGLEGLAKRRFFYAPAFSIYGGEWSRVWSRAWSRCGEIHYIVSCIIAFPVHIPL